MSTTGNKSGGGDDSLSVIIDLAEKGDVQTSPPCFGDLDLMVAIPVTAVLLLFLLLWMKHIEASKSQTDETIKRENQCRSRKQRHLYEQSLDKNKKKISHARKIDQERYWCQNISVPNTLRAY